MNKALIPILFIIFFLAGCQSAAPTSSITTIPATPTSQPAPTAGPIPSPTVEVAGRPLLLAHYMPWYQAPGESGAWGWHWTMNHYQPDREDENGFAEIASHYHPLTGPYDSSDEAILEYQVLLMKLSGIDGVIVDWFGFEDFRDYGPINESTHSLFNKIQQAGLLFAISYEDQSVKHMVEDKHLNANDAYAYGQKVMAFLQDTWFDQDAYLKFGDRPMLFVFGPQFFAGPADWETLFTGLKNRPLMITLDNHPSPSGSGRFPWPPMWSAKDGILTPDALDSYLAGFYKKGADWEVLVGGAFPGFYDIYQEAGVGASYGFLDSREGETFRSTLQTAIDHHPDLIQLITWNDYGEGTLIEPTHETGYRYLEIIQETRRTFEETGITYQVEDLRLPLRLYQLREKYTGQPEVQAQLDEAFEAFVSGDIAQAAGIIDSLAE